MQPPLIVDAHEDLAFNMLSFGRDYTRSALEIRKQETELGSRAPESTGEALLGWPEYQRGRVAVIFSTLFASPKRRMEEEWTTQAYANFDEAHRVYRGQLDAYRRLADQAPEKFQFITDRPQLEDLLALWATPGEHPVGLVPLMEGAEGVRSPAELEEWWQLGLHMIGLAWAGTRYCGGTREPGPLTEDGKALLRAMEEIGFTLDLSHMDELAARQALDLYAGPIIASHANAAALLPGYEGNRLPPDDVFRGLIEHDGIAGVVPFCAFLKTDWKHGDSRLSITLETLAAHVDHICQLAGDAQHVGLGTDFDGGFGLSAVPAEINTIADLQKLVTVLQAKGYKDQDVTNIMGGNWLRHLRKVLPA